MTVTESDVHDAFEMIMEECSDGYAKSYARAGLNHPQGGGPMRGEMLKAQVPYVLGNMSHWRGPSAKSVRATLKEFIK